MEKKQFVLPLNIDPFIKTYPINAFYIGILEAEGIDVRNLLINDFVNLHYYYFRKGGHIDFCGTGSIEKKRFKRVYNINLKNISIPKIKEIIENGYYLMVNLNEKYLSVPCINMGVDYYHDWLIYGYDEDEGTFKCCGYINEKSKGTHYGSISIKYENLINAMKNVPKRFLLFRARKLKNHSFTIDRNRKERESSKEEIIKQIKKFYNPPPIIFCQHLSIINNVHGIKAFMCSFKREHITRYSEMDSIFLQDIRNLYEHKKILKLILEKLECDDTIILLQEKLVREAYINLVLSYKYNNKPEKKLAEKIYKKILHVEERQKMVLNMVLVAMKNDDGF